MLVDGKTNPKDFVELAEANALQTELYFWAAEKIIKKSKDKKFLGKCVNLCVECVPEHAVLGQAMAAVASNRMARLDLGTLGFWRLNLVKNALAFGGWLRKLIPIRSKQDLAKEELRRFLKGGA